MNAERDMIEEYDLREKAVYSDDDYMGHWPMFHENGVAAALEQAEQVGIARVRDEIDKVIAQMKGVGDSDEAAFPDVVGNLVGASHIETLRKRLFG